MHMARKSQTKSQKTDPYQHDCKSFIFTDQQRHFEMLYYRKLAWDFITLYYLYSWTCRISKLGDIEPLGDGTSGCSSLFHWNLKIYISSQPVTSKQPHKIVQILMRPLNLTLLNCESKVYSRQKMASFHSYFFML